MTDKEQIIIDGVDIIDCDYFYVEQETDQVKCDNYSGYCRQHKNCPFKQLIRKTQECEELKKQLMQKSEVDMFFNTPIEGWSNDPCGICPHKAENEELLKENQQLRNSLSDSLMFKFTGQENETNRYRKALEEIEGIIKSSTKDFNHIDWEAKAAHALTAVDKISNIINKAKDGV